MALFAMFLAACGNGGKINPTSKKVNGPLGKYFEVVERDYKISDDELSVEFKRIAEGGPTSASWSSEPTFTVELQDEDGNVLSSESTQVVRSEEQLESVFSLGVDETASIKFKFDKTKGAVKFKVSSKWDESKESESGSQEENSTSGSDGTFDLKGAIIMTNKEQVRSSNFLEQTKMDCGILTKQMQTALLQVILEVST